MPAREFGVTLKVTDKGVAVLDKAGKAVGQAGQQAEKAGEGMKKLKFAMLAVSAIGVVAVVKGLQSLSSAAAGWIKASNEQEAALAKLRAATDGSIEPMVRAAEELQRLTAIGDETGIAMQALALNMGATAEQAPQVLMAAADMSAALGMDMEAAVRNVSKTLGGYAGELGELIPELKNLTQEQLQAGEGIELLAAKFKGQAEATMTFGDRVTQVSNIIGDFREKLGDIIKAAIEPMIGVVKQAAIAMDTWLAAHKAEVLERFAQGLKLLIDGGVAAVKVAGAVATAYADLRVVFAELTEKALKPVIEGLAIFVDGLGKAYAFVTRGDNPFTGLTQTLLDMSAGLKANVEDQHRFASNITQLVGTVENAAVAFGDKLKGGLDKATASQRENTSATQADVPPKREQEQAVDAVAAALQRAREREENYRQQLRATTKATQEATAEVSKYNQELQAFAAFSSTFQIGGTERVAFDKGDAASAVDRLKRIAGKQAGDTILRRFVESFAANIASGDIRALEQIVESVKAQAANIPATPLNHEVKASMTGLASTLARMLADLEKTAEPRALGGPVSAGQPYMVGERGPELFVPGSNGMIASNASMGETNQLLKALVGENRALRAALTSGGIPAVVGEGGLRAIGNGVKRLDSRNELRAY